MRVTNFAKLSNHRDIELREITNCCIVIWIIRWTISNILSFLQCFPNFKFSCWRPISLLLQLTLARYPVFLSGHPNITLAPGSRLPPPVQPDPEQPSKLDALSDSVMDNKALNDQVILLSIYKMRENFLISIWNIFFCSVICLSYYEPFI